MRFAALLLTLAGCASNPAFRSRTVLNDTDFVYDAQFSPDGQRVAVSRLGLHTFDVQVFEGARKLSEATVGPHAFDIEAVAFSADGSQLAVVSRDGSVRLFDAASGKGLGAFLTEGPLVSVAFHRSGIAVGSESGRVTLLSPSLQFLTEVQAHSASVRAMAFATDGRLFTAGWDKTIAVFTVAAARGGALIESKRFTFPAFPNDLTLDAAGRVLGVAFSESRAERSPEVFAREQRGEVEPEREWDTGARIDAETGKVLEKLSGHHGVVSTAAISPDGSTLATGGWDRTVWLHLKPAVKLERFGLGVRRVRFSADGSQLAAAAWTPQNPLGNHRSDPSAVVWELRTARSP